MATRRLAHEASKRVNRLKEFGMTFRQIADCTGVSYSVIRNLYIGKTRRVSTETYDKVLAVDVM